MHKLMMAALQWVFFYGLALVLLAYGGHLWSKSRTQALELAQCAEMLPNAVVDCPLAAQVAECNVKYPWATCETTSGAK